MTICMCGVAEDMAAEIEQLRAALEHIVKVYDYHVENYDHVPSNVCLMGKIARASLGEDK